MIHNRFKGDFFSPPFRGKQETEISLCKVFMMKLVNGGGGNLTLLFSVGSRESSVLLSTSPISSSETLRERKTHTHTHRSIFTVRQKQACFLGHQAGFKEEEGRVKP